MRGSGNDAVVELSVGGSSRLSSRWLACAGVVKTKEVLLGADSLLHHTFIDFLGLEREHCCKTQGEREETMLSLLNFKQPRDRATDRAPTIHAADHHDASRTVTRCCGKYRQSLDIVHLSLQSCFPSG